MKKSYKKWLGPVIAAVVAIVLVVVLFVTGVISFGDVKVPDITNMNVEEAGKILEENGLSICISETVIDDSVDENTVLSQYPEAGEKIQKDGKVDVTVSKKSVKADIPLVEGYDKELAVEILQNAGFKVNIKEKESDEYADGTVISQSDKGQAQTGSVITIIVSKNDKDTSDAKITVPLLVGKTPEEAKKLLGGKLYLKIVDEKFSSSVKKGAIISQDPASSHQVNEYTVIEVVISKGKASETQIIMPGVVNFSRTAAKSLLERAGLRVTIKEKYDEKVPAGVVMTQSIPQGKKVAANTTVTLVVSAGKAPEFTTIRPEDMPTYPPTTGNKETTKNDSQNVTVKPTENYTKPTQKPTEPAGESKYVAAFAITTDKNEVKAGDIITVSVKLKTNYNIVAVSLPVIYDSNVFEIVGTSESKLSSFLNFAGTLKENAYVTNGNWKSPDNMYEKNSNPDYWTSSMIKAKYKIAFATWVAAPSQGTVITSLNKEETIVTFKLKVKAGVNDAGGRIFMSQDFIKTASNPQGILSVGRTKTDSVNADSIVSTGQTINLEKATVLIKIK